MIPRRKIRYYSGEWIDVMKLVLTGRVGYGRYVKAFEESFAYYTGRAFAIAVCSGRSAVDMILDSFSLSAGDEVIMPANMVSDFIPLVKAKGFSPVLVDVERDSFNIDPALIERRITDKTKVIIPTHRYGLPADMDKISAVARKHGLKVIEDCAHALGARYKDKRVGSFGDAAFHVFGPTKPVNAFGGAMITTDDPKRAAFIREKAAASRPETIKAMVKVFISALEDMVVRSPLYALLSRLLVNRAAADAIVDSSIKLHEGLRPRYSAITNLQALMGLRQLDGLDARERGRTETARKIVERFSEKACVQAGSYPEGRIFHFLVARVTDKRIDVESLRRRLIMRGVDAGIKGEFADNSAGLTGRPDEYPAAEEAFNRTIQLPIFDNMEEKEISLITDAFNSVLSQVK